MRAHCLTASVTCLVLLTAACGGLGSDPENGEGGGDSVAADGGDPELDDLSLDELAELAAEEGEVVVYSFTSRIAQVEEAFEAEYPDIDFVGFDISSTEQIERLRAEAQSGNTSADVAYISDAPVVVTELVADNLLLPYVPADIADQVPEEHQQPLLANRLSTKVLMYNEEAYPDGSPVTNIWELVDEAWKGKVVMVDPLVRGDYLDLMTEFALRSEEMEQAYSDHYGSELELDEGLHSAGEQWIVDLLDNGTVLVESTDDVNAAVGAVGQADPPVGFTSYSDRRDNEDEGWALQVANDVQPSPGILFPALLGLTAEAPHPAAARLAIHFMMGDDSSNGGDAFAPFYVPGDYGTKSSIEPHPDAVPLEDFTAWRIDAERTSELRSDIADLVLAHQ